MLPIYEICFAQISEITFDFVKQYLQINQESEITIDPEMKAITTQIQFTPFPSESESVASAERIFSWVSFFIVLKMLSIVVVSTVTREGDDFLSGWQKGLLPPWWYSMLE